MHAAMNSNANSPGDGWFTNDITGESSQAARGDNTHRQSKDEDSGRAPLLAGKEGDECFTCDEAIDQMGMGMFQYKLTALIGAHWTFGMAMLIAVIPFMLLGAKNEMGFPPLVEGLVAASNLVGAMVGGCILGPLSDEVGRRPVILWAMVLGSVGTALGAACPEPISLSFTRIMVGTTLAGIGIVTNNLLCEGLPSSTRAVCMAALHIAWQVGKLIVIGLSIPIQSHEWRTMLLIVATPPLLLAILAWFTIRESSRFLLVTGSYSEAVEELQYIADENGVSLPPGRLEGYPKKEEESIWSRGLKLMDPCLKQTSVLLFVLFFLVNYGSYGTSIYLLQFYSDQGKEKLASMCYMAETLGNIVGISLVCLFMDKVDRRLLLLLGFLGDGTISMIFFNMPTEWGTLAMMFVKGIFSDTIWTVIYVYTPECYPSSVRGTGTGFITSLSRVGSIVAALSGAALFSIEPHLLFYLAGTLNITAAFITLFLPIETRGVQLQDEMAELRDRQEDHHRLMQAGDWDPKQVSIMHGLWIASCGSVQKPSQTAQEPASGETHGVQSGIGVDGDAEQNAASDELKKDD